ncbi:MAG: hypothetical protein U5K73_00685 [Halofilum sp. (in: g-proteobacteria)]|nr:hypothetical protein [Halofilum sp. (in: g-proteobacteria)]
MSSEKSAARVQAAAASLGSVAGLGIAGGAGRRCILRGEEAPRARAPAAQESPQASGYRETDHIRKYYETARD